MDVAATHEHSARLLDDMRRELRVLSGAVPSVEVRMWVSDMLAVLHWAVLQRVDRKAEILVAVTGN